VEIVLHRCSNLFVWCRNLLNNAIHKSVLRLLTVNICADANMLKLCGAVYVATMETRATRVSVPTLSDVRRTFIPAYDRHLMKSKSDSCAILSRTNCSLYNNTLMAGMYFKSQIRSYALIKLHYKISGVQTDTVRNFSTFQFFVKQSGTKTLTHSDLKISVISF
jgi:hypothetical protein